MSSSNNGDFSVALQDNLVSRKMDRIKTFVCAILITGDGKTIFPIKNSHNPRIIREQTIRKPITIIAVFIRST